VSDRRKRAGPREILRASAGRKRPESRDEGGSRHDLTKGIEREDRE
jgi:hypothetical protein